MTGINKNVKREYKKSMEGTIRSREMKVTESFTVVPPSRPSEQNVAINNGKENSCEFK